MDKFTRITTQLIPEAEAEPVNDINLRIIVYKRMNGETAKSIAQEMGVTRTTIHRKLSTPQAKQLWADIEQERKEHMASVQRSIDDFAPKAVKTLGRNLTAKNAPASAQNQAAIHLLGLSGFRAPEAQDSKLSPTAIAGNVVSILHKNWQKITRELEERKSLPDPNIIDADFELESIDLRPPEPTNA